MRMIDMAALARDVAEFPDAYQYERAARFDVSPKAICQALRKLWVTYKKTLNHPKADATRPARFKKKM